MSSTTTMIAWMQSLSDPTRSRILRILERSEVSVAELCNVLQLPQSTVSRHLKVLIRKSFGVSPRTIACLRRPPSKMTRGSSKSSIADAVRLKRFSPPQRADGIGCAMNSSAADSMLGRSPQHSIVHGLSEILDVELGPLARRSHHGFTELSPSTLQRP